MPWRHNDRGHHRTRTKLITIAESIKRETNDAPRKPPTGDAVTLKAMPYTATPTVPPHLPHGVEGRARGAACPSFALRQDHQGKHRRYHSAAHSRQAHGKGNGRKALPAKAQSQRNVAGQKGVTPEHEGKHDALSVHELFPDNVSQHTGKRCGSKGEPAFQRRKP